MVINGQSNGKPQVVCANLEFQLEKCSAAPGGNLYPILCNILLMSPLVTLSGSAEKQASIHPLTSGPVHALPAPDRLVENHP